MKTLRVSGRIAAIAAAAALAGGLAPQSAHADDIADFYKDKRIQLLIGAGPGGGYDTYGRLVGRHLGRFIPGTPQIIAKNMDGAGSVVVMNFVANVAPKDGSIIAGVQRNLALVQIMGQPGPKFKAEEINWLGSLANEAGVCAVDKRTGLKIGEFKAALDRQFVMGGTGPNDTEIQPALFNNTIGTKFQLIKGYPSTGPVHLAIQRGEVDGVCQSWSSFKEHSGNYYRDGNMIPLVQMSLKPNPELAKLGVPMIYEFITAGNMQNGLKVEQVKGLYNLLFAAKAMGRPFAMAPGVPQERVKAIRAAFNEMAADPKFLRDSEKQRREVELVTGEEIQQIVEGMAKTPKEDLKLLDDLQQYKGVAKVAKIEMARHTGKVQDVVKGGRQIVIVHEGKKVKAQVSGSRTKVTVGGKEAKRSAVKAGMTCTFVYPGPGEEAKQVDCKP